MSNLTVPASSFIQLNPLPVRPRTAPAPAAPAGLNGLRLIPLDQLLPPSRLTQTPAPVPAKVLGLPPLPAFAPQPAPAVSRPAMGAVSTAVGKTQTDILGPGAKGQAVEYVQRRLQHWGYKLDDDGDYGKRTFDAVSQFQRDQGLGASGRVDAPTRTALAAEPQSADALDEVRAGRVQLNRGAKGEAVEYVQERLKVWGYDLGKPDGDYGPRTQNAVRQFQQSRNIQGNGSVGKTTLAALEQTPVTAGRLQSNSDAERLARTARSVAARRDTVGWCYSGVATAVSRALGVELYGRSAYQASNILARHDDFREVHALKPKDLPKLPAGAVVVWGKTRVSPHGHISVALGNGREASDHIAEQMTSLRGHTNFRVFMPVG